MVRIDTATLSKIRVGIIDIFGKKKGIAINGLTKDYTHGELTSATLERLTKDLNVNIQRIPVGVRAQSGNLSFEFKSLLKQLKKINRNGKDYDYINLSNSCVLPYEVVGLSQGGKELADPAVRRQILEMLRTPENINNIHKQLRILSPKQDPKLQITGQISHIIDELERIQRSGTKIYISACNKAKGFNLFSLAEGTHTIGGCDGVTKVPIKRFSSNPLVESYENLPVYVTKQNAITHEAEKTAINLNGVVKIDSSLAKLSRKELAKKYASKEDYAALKQYVDELYSSGKFKFDTDFMRFALLKNTDKRLHGKIYEIDKFMKIFEGKFDDEVLKYTFPQGTHCDIMFRQFFDMTSKSKHVISMKKTTKIPNTLSGTSFAAPQGLNRAIRNDIGEKLFYSA